MGGARPRQRLGLLIFGSVFAALFLGFAITQGIGRPGVPAGAVAVVEGAPADTGTIIRRKFDRAFAQVVRAAGVKEAPKPGDPQYEELMEATMSGLLSAVWLEGQAAEMGIALEPGRAIEEFRSVKGEEFETQDEFREYLRTTLVNRRELIERVRLQLLGAEIEKRFEEGADTSGSPQSTQDAQRERSDELLADFTDKWTSRTTCAAGFTTESCANFKPTGHPVGAPPGCYESNPEGDILKACPAPVVQARAAQPGTVSVLEPQGEQLAQRPRPQG